MKIELPFTITGILEVDIDPNDAQHKDFSGINEIITDLEYVLVQSLNDECLEQFKTLSATVEYTEEQKKALYEDCYRNHTLCSCCEDMVANEDIEESNEDEDICAGCCAEAIPNPATV